MNIYLSVDREEVEVKSKQRLKFEHRAALTSSVQYSSVLRFALFQKFFRRIFGTKH